MKTLTVLLSMSFGILTAVEKPNIVFIMADDLGWQDVGFMGSQYFETPFLDQLADESAVFENAFMYPTCSPSRAALLTGRQSFRTQCYTVPVLEKGKAGDNIFSKWTVTEEHPVYSQPLREAGYQLIHLGKWHIVGPDPKGEDRKLASGKKLGQPKNGDLSWLESHKEADIKQFYPTGRGFHRNVGGLWWGDPARGYDQGYNAEGGGYIAPFKNPFIQEQQDGKWLTDHLMDEAMEFIKEQKDQPFFVNLHLYAPHRPSVARSAESLSHFKKKKGDPVTGQDPKKLRGIADYATMVKSIDDNVKRMVNFLEQEGLRENTIIVFTSDNGFNGMQSVNKRLRGAKGNVYDGGLRVPLLINWPNEVKPSRLDYPVAGLDLFPTFLDLAQVEAYPHLLDGQSIVPVAKGEPIETQPLFWHIASRYKDAPCSIIRSGEWKLIQFLLDGKVELYHTGNDLKEAHDLSQKNSEKTEELLTQLLEWRKMNDVPLPKNSVLDF